MVEIRRICPCCQKGNGVLLFLAETESRILFGLHDIKNCTEGEIKKVICPNCNRKIKARVVPYK